MSFENKGKRTNRVKKGEAQRSWQRAAFGTLRSWVRTPSPRPKRDQGAFCALSSCLGLRLFAFQKTLSSSHWKALTLQSFCPVWSTVFLSVKPSAADEKFARQKTRERDVFGFFVPYTTICRASGESNRQKNFWNTMGATGDRNTGKTEVLNERHKQCSVSPKRGCQYHIVSALKYLMLIRQVFLKNLKKFFGFLYRK